MSNAIQDKTRAFAIRIINCYKFLTEERHEFVMSKQVLRCGTTLEQTRVKVKMPSHEMTFLANLA